MSGRRGGQQQRITVVLKTTIRQDAFKVQLKPASKFMGVRYFTMDFAGESGQWIVSVGFVPFAGILTLLPFVVGVSEPLCDFLASCNNLGSQDIFIVAEFSIHT